MTNQSKLNLGGVTRKQAIVLLVLGAGLLFALMPPSSKTEDQTAESVTGIDAVRARRKALPTKSAEWTPKWPSIPLEEMLKVNPFARIDSAESQIDSSVSDPSTSVAAVEPSPENSDPESVEEPASTEQLEFEKTLADFQRQKVKATFRSGNKVGAIVGDRLIHEGEIVDGLRIVSILPTGVLVEPAKTE